MSRNAIIAVTIGAIIILGAVAAFLYSQTKSSSENVDTAMVAKEEEAPKNGMSLSTITDIFTRGENQMCTFNTTTDQGETSGTIYVSGKNARGEFETTVDDETFTTNMIRNDDTFYMWGDSFPTGMKMVMSIDEWASQVQDEPGDSEATTTFDPNAKVDFKCTSWTVDENIFEAPTNVKFMTIEGSLGEDTATFQMTDDDENEESMDQCSICNSLSGNAKNVCLEQFNCQ